MNNAMADNLRKIAKLCELGTEAWEVAEAINSTSTTARHYANVMVYAGFLRCEKIETHMRGCAYKRVWYSNKTELTDDDIEMLIPMLSKSHSVHKDISRIRKEAEKKEPVIDYKQKVQNELREQEKQGIYRLNTNPSDYFIKKIRETQAEDSKERKSPKNYAGISAGMVW